MSDNIKINPFSSDNKLGNITSNNITGGNILPNINYLSTSDFMINKIINEISFISGYIKFENKFINQLIESIICGSLVKLVIDIIGNIELIPNYLKKILYSMYQKFKTFVNRNKDIMIEKTVDISYITSTKNINELYKAVSWYLSNNTEIDYLHEPFIEFTSDKKDIQNNNLSINKILTNNKTKEIKYNNHTINYILNSEIITIYTDSDKKRENYKIILKTLVNKKEKIDILENFCQFCLSEYVIKEWS